MRFSPLPLSPLRRRPEMWKSWRWSTRSMGKPSASVAASLGRWRWSRVSWVDFGDPQRVSGFGGFLGKNKVHKVPALLMTPEFWSAMKKSSVLCEMPVFAYIFLLHVLQWLVFALFLPLQVAFSFKTPCNNDFKGSKNCPFVFWSCC